ncbi:hypothetical protein GSI_05868 [Ganoderma sinense ZZ0214-1]|uniref:Protein kinase domain-containing protein n=1 Tax=Ganoderma sinense ZZ0214-1 TaxID=1077348 RepID=A0A2G8SBP7_9APHY|nr:hypothetical protein GSI_05868 [Ganoderma sinense ZZ0214-1]
MTDITGCIIHDRYQLVEMLGCGSYGIVYKAIDLEVEDDSDNIVALKIMRLADRSDSDLTTIEREVIMHSAASGIDGVVTLLDSFDDEMWCCIVMQYCSGGDLFDQSITKQAYVGNDELLRTAFLSLVDAVQACHELGIAHRDLKLENVFTSEDGSRCFLGDFTLATNEPIVCDFGVGTKRYMSPECLGRTTHREPYNPYLSDVWALGIILCTMATGGFPWRRATYSDARYCRFLEDPDFLHDALRLSAGAQDIVQGLLAPFPHARTSLPALREAVLALDTFFRPASDLEHAVPEHEREREYTAVVRLEIAAGEPTEYEYAYASMVPEIDILCGGPGPRVSPWDDSSAGSAMDVDDGVDVDEAAPNPFSSSRYYRTDSCSSSLSAESEGLDDARGSVFSLDCPITLTAHVLWDDSEVMGEDGRKGASGFDGW